MEGRRQRRKESLRALGEDANQRRGNSFAMLINKRLIKTALWALINLLIKLEPSLEQIESSPPRLLPPVRAGLDSQTLRDGGRSLTAQAATKVYRIASSQIQPCRTSRLCPGTWWTGQVSTRRLLVQTHRAGEKGLRARTTGSVNRDFASPEGAPKNVQKFELRAASRERKQFSPRGGALWPGPCIPISRGRAIALPWTLLGPCPHPAQQPGKNWPVFRQQGQDSQSPRLLGLHKNGVGCAKGRGSGRANPLGHGHTTSSH